MGLFENFPYTNFHELNLDWILSTIKQLDSEIDEFVQNNVLTYADPIQWDITTQYAKNTVVVGPDGTAYMSIAPVPTNILLTNTDYWQPIFNYSETVTVLKKQIAAADMGDSKTALVSVPLGGLFWQLNTLYRAKKAISAGDGFVTGSNCELCTVEEAIKNVIAPTADLGRSGKNITDSATGAYSRNADSFTDTTQGAYSRNADSFTDTAQGACSRNADSFTDAARGAYIRNAESFTDTASETIKRTAKDIIDKADGNSTENCANKSLTAADIVIHSNDNLDASITNTATVTAKDLKLNVANHLTYEKPNTFNDFFNSVKMKDAAGELYDVLVAGPNIGDISKKGGPSNVVYVEDFGAVGDGVTDDTAAIQAAVDSFPNGNGVIVFNPKVYRTTGTISITKPFTVLSGYIDHQREIAPIIMCDSSTVPVISIDGGTTQIEGCALRFITATRKTMGGAGTKTISISNVLFTTVYKCGFSKSAYGVYGTNINGLYFWKCHGTFGGSAGAGAEMASIYIDGTTKGNSGILVEGLVAYGYNTDNATTYGVLYRSAGTQAGDIRLVDLEFSGHMNYGVYYSHTGGSFGNNFNIDGLHMDRCDACGVFLSSDSNNEADNCNISNLWILLNGDYASSIALYNFTNVNISNIAISGSTAKETGYGTAGLVLNGAKKVNISNVNMYQRILRLVQILNSSYCNLSNIVSTCNDSIFEINNSEYVNLCNITDPKSSYSVTGTAPKFVNCNLKGLPVTPTV